MDLWGFTLEMRGALYACGRLARALQGRVVEETKPADAPEQQSTSVSVVDRLCQDVLFLRASELTRDLNVYSEELAACPPEILALFPTEERRYVLVLDPVDGTDDYLAGKDTYAHMLGILDRANGRMQSGMIYFPARDRLYLAVRGHGAWMATGLWGHLDPVRHTAPRRAVAEVKRLTTEDREALVAAGFALVPERSASAAFELVRVAEGELGVSVLRSFHGHDSAMGGLLIELLGGAMLDGWGNPVTYEAGMPRMPLLVTSLAPDMAREVAALLRGHTVAPDVAEGAGAAPSLAEPLAAQADGSRGVV
ncbi:MAG: inositol monophosphatase family protein [Anaerolineae bacterium]